jgi:arylsulfatase A-like enzyme
MPPNVCLIILDDIGIEQFERWGRDPTNTYAPTPNIDRMCQDGVRLSRFYSQPVCSPTRASTLTGRYPFHTGIGVLAQDDQMPLRAVETCLPRAVQQGTDHAYVSAAFGKWHVSTSVNGGDLHPNIIGFDHFAGVMGNLERGKDSYFSYRYVVDGKVSRRNVYEPTNTVNAALEWIGEQTRPWLAWVAFNACHEPMHRPPADLYDTTRYVLPNPEPLTPTEEVDSYKAMQQAMDTELGRFLASLDQGTRANTVFIVFSDNGTPGALMPAIGVPVEHNKGSVYEYGVNTPAVVFGYGVAGQGRVCDNLVNCVDIFDTVLDIVGADTSLVTSAGIRDSVSFWPVIHSRRSRNARSPGGSQNYVFVERFMPNGVTYSVVTGTVTPGDRATIGDKYKIVCRVPGLIGATSHIIDDALIGPPGPPPGFPTDGTATAAQTDLMYNLYADQIEAGDSMLAGGWPGPGPIPTVNGFLTQEEWDAYQALKTYHNNKTRDIP